MAFFYSFSLFLCYNNDVKISHNQAMDSKVNSEKFLKFIDAEGAFFNTEHSFQEVSKAILNFLDTIGDKIVKHPTNKYAGGVRKSDLTGRSGSATFENSMVKSIINKYKKSLIKEANKELGNDNFILKDIIAPVIKSENGKRKGYDFLLLVNIKDVCNMSKETLIKVNIKATSGKTYDNTGGKSIIVDSLLPGRSKNLTHKEILKEAAIFVETGEQAQIFSDYYFLSFKKGKSKPTIGYTSFSMLTNNWASKDSNMMSFNKNQTFPHLQARAKKNVELLFCDDITMARKAMVRWIFPKIRKFTEDELSSLKSFTDDI